MSGNLRGRILHPSYVIRITKPILPRNRMSFFWREDLKLPRATSSCRSFLSGGKYEYFRQIHLVCHGKVGYIPSTKKEIRPHSAKNGSIFRFLASNKNSSPLFNQSNLVWSVNILRAFKCTLIWNFSFPMTVFKEKFIYCSSWTCLDQFYWLPGHK